MLLRILLVFAFLLGPVFVSAQDVHLQGSVGVGGYAMDNVNDFIEEAGVAMGQESFEKLTSGRSFEVGFLWDLSDKTSLGFGYERLTGETSLDLPVGALFDYDVTAGIYRLYLQTLVRDAAKFNWGGGAALGLINARGQYKRLPAEMGPIDWPISGTDLYFEPFLLGELRLGYRFALVARAGYRFAKIDEVEYNGVVVEPEDGSDFGLDYGGLVAHLGFKLRLPTGTPPPLAERTAPKSRASMIDPAKVIEVAAAGLVSFPSGDFASDHEMGPGGLAAIGFYPGSRLGVGVEGSLNKFGGERGFDDQTTRLFGYAKYLFRPDLTSHYVKAAVGVLSYDYGLRVDQDFMGLSLGAGYQYRAVDGFGLFAEGMLVTWTVEGGGGPQLDLRVGLMALLGD